MCLYKQNSEYASGPRYAKNLNKEISECGRVANIIALHSVMSEYARMWLGYGLDMPGYFLTEF